MRVCETICLNEAEFTSLGPGVDDLPGLMADASDADASPRRGEGTRTPELTLSVLDLVPVGSGSTPAHALRNSVTCFTMGKPAAMNNDFMMSLSMPAAEPSTPAPT